MDETESKKGFDSKVCAVCGDHALGYNFNAVTCESCKAFFRRNAVKHKELRCPFEGSCHITAVTRRFCQKCRLAKCYKVGMKRELIMTEEAKERKRKKIQDNRKMQESAKRNELTTSCGVQVGTSLSLVDTGVQTEPEDTQYLGCLTPASQSSGFTYSPVSVPPSPSENASLVYVEHSKGYLDYRVPLASKHVSLLQDLIAATKALEAPVDQEVSNLPGDEFKSCGSKSLIDVINLTAVAIRRLIKMCKRIQAFRTLCQEDQLTLLKQGCTQMMLLRSVVTFDPDKNSWKIPHTVDKLSQIKVEVLKEARGNLYEAHESFLRTFDQRASNDASIMCVLTALALFDPQRTNLIEREIIRGHQECYYDLLQRYLESIYHVSEANKMYRHLIDKMYELRRLNEEHIRVYLNVNPSLVEPLLIEIFDLKPH